MHFSHFFLSASLKLSVLFVSSLFNSWVINGQFMVIHVKQNYPCSLKPFCSFSVFCGPNKFVLFVRFVFVTLISEISVIRVPYSSPIAAQTGMNRTAILLSVSLSYSCYSCYPCSLKRSIHPSQPFSPFIICRLIKPDKTL